MGPYGGSDERRETASNQMSATNTTADQWRAIGAVAEVPVRCRRAAARRPGEVQKRPHLRGRQVATDTSEIGPLKGAPAIIGAGMAGDRASVIFSAPEEISAWIKPSC